MACEFSYHYMRNAMLNKLLLSLLFTLSHGQQTATGLGPYQCWPETGISMLPACDSLNSTIRSCFPNGAAKPTDPECFCNQDALNQIINCESELRLCYETDHWDYLAENVLGNWHNDCDDFITFDPTTPPVSEIATTRTVVLGGDQEAYCSDLLTTCYIWSSAEADCLNLDPSATAQSFLECACSTSLLSLASVCLFDGNTTCLGETAAISNIPLFSICGATYSDGTVITGTNMPTFTSNSSAGARTTPTMTTAPRTTSRLASQTSSSVSVGVAVRTKPSIALLTGILVMTLMIL